MNTDFTITGNKVMVFTDKEVPVERDATNNIEEILICENNIEEIEDNLQKSKKHITFLQNKLWFNWGTIASAILWVGCGIFTICINSQAWIACIPFLCGAGLTAMTIDDIKSNLRFIKEEKCVVKELETNLQSENEKLNELNKNKANNLIKQNRKTIYRSEQIDDLKGKLDIIYNYQINKSKFIKYYNKGILKAMLVKYFDPYFFTKEDYLILEELIKNDLNKKEEKSNVKQKTLRRK